MYLKLITMSIIGLSLGADCFAQEEKVNAKSEVKEVTVFSGTAQINRTASADVKAGKNTIVLAGLSEYIDPQTIQVTAKNNFTIISVGMETDYSELLTSETISDSVSLTEKEIKLIGKQIEIADAEKEMLKANIAIGGQSGVKVQELKEAADFYSFRMNKIVMNKLELEDKKEKLSKKLALYKAQLSGKQDNTRRSKILVNITSAKADKIEMEINYIVRGASWEPFYDVRATDGSPTVNLAYKAKVSQRTGEDWNNVKIKLSGGNPNLSGSKPNLQTWYLSFQESFYGRNKGMNFFQNQVAMAPIQSEVVEEQLDEMEIADLGEAKQGMTNVEFIINLPYTILSEGKPYVVEIQNNELPVSYVYYGVRRMEKEAFLIAKVSGWEKLNLLAGETNLFLDGTYTGKSYIDPRLMKDSMELSLGRDNTIMLTRVKEKEYSERKSLSSSQIDYREWKLTARNTKNREIDLILEDLIPVSTNKEIEVIVDDISGAELNENTGLLSWKLNLKPSEQKTLYIKYKVKYPKNKSLYLE